jgi:hypothetical protein
MQELNQRMFLMQKKCCISNRMNQVIIFKNVITKLKLRKSSKSETANGEELISAVFIYYPL